MPFVHTRVSETHDKPYSAVADLKAITLEPLAVAGPLNVALHDPAATGVGVGVGAGVAVGTGVGAATVQDFFVYVPLKTPFVQVRVCERQDDPYGTVVAL